MVKSIGSRLQHEIWKKKRKNLCKNIHQTRRKQEIKNITILLYISSLQPAKHYINVLKTCINCECMKKLYQDIESNVMKN